MADKKPSGDQGLKRAGTMEELSYIRNMYQNQYSMVQQSINSRLEFLRQMDEAHTALEHLDQMNKKNTLMHVGSAVYIKSTVADAKSAVVGVGAGYLVEKEVAAAKAHISKMLEKETEEINKLGKTKAELEKAMVEISYKIEELSR